MSRLPEETDPDPSEPLELSRFLLSQIEARIKENLGAAERQPKYYVIRGRKTHVLSVLASSTLGEDHDIVWGPHPFAACIAFVNSTMVTRQAIGGEPDGAGGDHPNPEEQS